MDKFFTFLKKGLVGTMVVLFAFVATYIPQPQVAEAKGEAKLSLQVIALVEQASTALSSAASAASNALIAISTAALELKEFVLDGIAWGVVKGIIHMMVQDMINWINSGFNGRPQFVEDLNGFLTEAADNAFGEYIAELGDGKASFICSPFRQDIQVALSVKYQQARSGQAAPTCKLSGVVDNIEDFMNGSQGSFSSGGWNDWIDITSQPETYTPFGSLVSADLEAQARIVNEQGKELNLLKFGSGMLSSKNCKTVKSPSGLEKLFCSVTTPGKTIQESLSFNLDSTRQSLVAADEIDEMIGSLFAQLANQLFTGAASLLDL